MVLIEDVVKTPGGGVVISALLGLGLATVFRRACVGGTCYVVRGPSVEHVTGHVWRVDGKCFKYTPFPVECDGTESNASRR
jgi:hypothetical protein